MPYCAGACSRQDSNFDQAAVPVDMPGTDPSLNPGYTLSNTATTDLGGGIIERTLSFSSITGPVQLEEMPLEGTLVVFDGTVPMADLAVQRDQQRDFLHRGDVRLCARRTARPQGLRERTVQIPAPIKLRHLDQVSLSTACLLPPCLSKRSQ